MKVIFADDDAAMRERMVSAAEGLKSEFGVLDVCGVAEDGERLIQLVEENAPVDMIISDMRMPNMDGLSAMVYLLAKYKAMHVILLTSESIVGSDEGDDTAENEEKYAMLNQIALRLINKETAPDKINSMLEGCEKLGLSTKTVAKHFGARGFVRKPFSAKKLTVIMKQLKAKTPFIEIDIITRG
ncbi:MAG: response regulator [Kordiimonadaceae bacterium]|nr:response regulator [Kordiimonadaceae bacterium]